MTASISQKDFEDRLQAGTMVLTLVGMSNIGKTHWAKQLAYKGGFTHICCDDLIEAELSPVLKKHGYKGITDIAKWLGRPHDKQFVKNQETYLELEILVLERIIKQLERSGFVGNTIIDTTGSLVHTGPEIYKRLSEPTTVIFLEATQDMQQEMLRLYIEEPKPVVWGHTYRPKAEEHPKQTLNRCYPELLTYRSGLYSDMADVIIPRGTLLGITNIDDFLDYVKQALPKDYS